MKRKKLRIVGAVRRRDTGRSEIVYGRKCKTDNIEHEVWLTELEVILKCPIEQEAKVGKTRADGVFITDGRKCFVEIDNSGHMDAKQMRAKWRRYEGVEDFILVVAMTDSRMEMLKQGAELVKALALFTTFRRLREGRPWVDCFGGTVTL